MQIFDTLSGTKKELVQPEGRPINMFVCGPTVYDEPHIGNARTFVQFDIVARYLRSRGFKLFYLQNITNIDDKILDRAQQEGVAWSEISARYETIFREGLERLGVTSIDQHARSTEFIPQVIAQVKALIKNGNAYKIEGHGWYFDLSTYPEYGQLARRTVEQAEDGVSRIDSADKKRNAGDFALWKFPSSESEPRWEDAELGAGRPGWHIEDTATTEHFFGPQYDIHGGGLDLKFPHHEAERAQQEAASGKKPFVNIWMHAGLLTINSKKMSKSLGNFLTMSDVLKNHSPEAFRMMVLMHHYRSPLDYTEQLVHTAHKNVADLNAFVARLGLVTGDGEPVASRNYREQIAEAMDDDFNTPKALAIIYELMNENSKTIWSLPKKRAQELISIITDTFSAFGIRIAPPVVPLDVTKLVEERELSRTSKQFDQSDALRKRIEALGYVIEDTPNGPLALPKA